MPKFLNISCMSATVSVRVKKSLMEKVRKHRINVSKTVREALEEEVKKREKLAQAAAEAARILQKIPDDEIVRTIRESRDER